jgi:hypothetical protein
LLSTDSGYAGAVVKQVAMLSGVLLLAACSSESTGKAPTNCNIEGLTGTWKFHYEQQSGGNCGPLKDELVDMYLFLNLSGGGCVVDSRKFSEDKCQLDTKYQCPSLDQSGTQSWTIMLRQVAADRLTGTGMTKLEHPTAGTCQSTYNLTITPDATAADAGG